MLEVVQSVPGTTVVPVYVSYVVSVVTETSSESGGTSVSEDGSAGDSVVVEVVVVMTEVPGSVTVVPGSVTVVPGMVIVEPDSVMVVPGSVVTLPGRVVTLPGWVTVVPLWLVVVVVVSVTVIGSVLEAASSEAGTEEEDDGVDEEVCGAEEITLLLEWSSRGTECGGWTEEEVQPPLEQDSMVTVVVDWGMVEVVQVAHTAEVVTCVMPVVVTEEVVEVEDVVVTVGVSSASLLVTQDGQIPTVMVVV